MSEDYLRRQAIFRIVAFFVITIAIGFIASDINILAGQ
jgi:preprotein translocase subunit SecG